MDEHVKNIMCQYVFLYVYIHASIYLSMYVIWKYARYHGVIGF